MANVAQCLLHFVAEETAAIDELRAFVGGNLGPALDGSLDSIRLLDEYLENLRRSPGWQQTLVQLTGHGDPETWLKVRVGYYLGWHLRRRYGVLWSLGADRTAPTSETPVLVIRGVEVSPLEIADAQVQGRVEGGLVGLLHDLQHEIDSRLKCPLPSAHP